MSSSSKRDRRIFVRASDQERKALNQNATAHHMTLSSFLRELGLIQPHLVRINKLQQGVQQATVTLHQVKQLHRLEPTEPMIQELITQLAVLLVEMDQELNVWSHDCQHNRYE
jgi:transposase-like protein